MLGRLLAAHFAPADNRGRAQVVRLAAALQAATAEGAEVAYADQAYTAARGIRLEVVKHAEAERGFVLLPAAGWSSAPSPRLPAPGGWPGITSGCPTPCATCTSSSSLASWCKKPPRYSRPAPKVGGRPSPPSAGPDRAGRRLRCAPPTVRLQQTPAQIP